MSGSKNKVHPLQVDANRMELEDLEGNSDELNPLPAEEDLNKASQSRSSYIPWKGNVSHTVKKIVTNEGRYEWIKPLSERRRLMSGSVKKLSGFSAIKLDAKRRLGRVKLSFKDFGYKLTLFRGSFKSIEGYQGSGVLSYFVFLKWLLKLNFYIFFLVFLFITLPQTIFPTQDYSQYITGSTNTTSAVDLANTCSALYVVNISHTAKDYILDFLQGTGWMEKTTMFFGEYASSELSVGFSFNYNMPLAFLTVTLICYLISLLLMAVHTAGIFRESLAHTGKHKGRTPNMIFGSWDFALTDEIGAKFKHKNLYTEIGADIADTEFAKQRDSRTSCDKCRLYTIRILVNLIVLGALGGGGYLIYYVTTWTTEYVQSSAYTSQDSFVQLLVEFLPSLTITGLNAFCPVLFGILIIFEKYPRSMEIKLLLIRIVFLKMASLAVLVVALYTEITCNPVDSCSVGTSPCAALQCWETYVGQQFYKLVILDFLVAVATTFLVEFPKKLLATKCDCCLARLIPQPEYDIPKNVLDLVNSQMHLWIGFFFAPLIPAICVIKFFATFYLKKFSVLINCVPPARPYKASKSNSFFMVILLMAFFLSCIPVVWSVVKLTPSKGCGPFRIYSNMYKIYTVVISSWPAWLQGIIDFLSSSAFVIPFILIVMLIAYYYSVVADANKDMVKLLKEQLVLEGHDKQFLMKQVAYASGAPVRPKKKPQTSESVVPQLPNTKNNGVTVKMVDESGPKSPSSTAIADPVHDGDDMW